jgi:cysteine desulfurase family protein
MDPAPEHAQRPVIYLNNAATSWPKPTAVLTAVTESFTHPFFGAGRGPGGQGRDYPSETREVLARFFDGTPLEHFIFSQNATDGLNTLIHGFLAAEGDRFHVLTTTLEHNSVLRPLHELQQQGRITLDIIPFTGTKVNTEFVVEAVRPGTRLMVMTHGSNVLGSVQDVQAIGEYLQDQGVYFIVDGAQTAGHVPVRLSGMPLDAYVFTGHKGLFGMPGIGGFFIRDPDRVFPVRTGGTGTDSRSLSHPREMPERFEIGTPNYPGIASLGAGIEFIESVGLDTLTQKAECQTHGLIHELSIEPNITIYNTRPELPIVSFNIAGLNNDDIGYILAKRYNIIVRTGLHCAPLVHQVIDEGKGCVRVSPSWFTTDEECQAVAAAIREISHHAYSPVRPA